MWDIITKIWLCLLIASILGGIIGWLLKTLFGSKCAKCEEYEGEVGRLKASLGKVTAGANAENSKDDAEIASLKAKIASLEGDLSASNNLNAEWKTKYAGLETESGEWKTKYAGLETESSEWKTKLATLTAAGATGAAVASGGGDSEEIARLNKEIEALNAKLKVVRSDDAADEAEIKRLRGELETCSTKLNETENERIYLLGQVKKAESGESIKREVPMDQRDDLELINGVGPVLERMLYDMGIYFFKDVAGWDAAKIAEIDAQLPRFKGRIEREGWVESAKEEHFKKYGERL